MPGMSGQLELEAAGHTAGSQGEQNAGCSGSWLLSIQSGIQVMVQGHPRLGWVFPPQFTSSRESHRTCPAETGLQMAEDPLDWETALPP